MKLDHINIKANKHLLETVKDFYCKILDMEEGFRPSVSIGGYWLYSEDKAILHLMESEESLQANPNSHLDHIAFKSSGLKAMIDKLSSNNIDHHSNYLPEFDMTQLFIYDPVGNQLEINFENEKL